MYTSPAQHGLSRWGVLQKNLNSNQNPPPSASRSRSRFRADGHDGHDGQQKEWFANSDTAARFQPRFRAIVSKASVEAGEAKAMAMAKAKEKVAGDTAGNSCCFVVFVVCFVCITFRWMVTYDNYSVL